MATSGNIIEFPTGRPFGGGSPDSSRNRSVVVIVQRLSRRAPTSGRGIQSDASLPIRLSQLVGVNDETIDRLSVLARDGIVTPESAARLAMRHADERVGWHPRHRLNAGGAVAYDLTLAGDPFGRFAFRMRGRTAWLLFAPTSGVGLLSEMCLDERIQACLLIGCEAGRRTTVRLLRPADWSRRLAFVSAGTNRCGSRHILLIGGLPRHGPERSSALAAVELAVRRGGNTKLVSSTLRKRLDARAPFPILASARELLTMIELAFPGLVEVPVAAGGSAP